MTYSSTSEEEEGQRRDTRHGGKMHESNGKSGRHQDSRGVDVQKRADLTHESYRQCGL